MGHAQGLFARPFVACLLRPRPRQRCPRLAHTATVALASLAIVIAATVLSQSAAAVALAATAIALAATAIALAATACATLSLAAAVASVAFAFAFAAAAQPAQSASAALAALSTVEGRGTSALSHSIAPHRDGSIGVRNVIRFLLDFGCKRRINAIFSRGAAAPHPAVDHVQRFSL